MTESVLLDHRPVETKLTGALAYWVRYRSHDLHGVATESTGLVIAPSTPVTSGDERRVMTWCHGTTGLGDAACPSAKQAIDNWVVGLYNCGNQLANW